VPRRLGEHIGGDLPRHAIERSLVKLE
jgi:hypothetical protein